MIAIEHLDLMGRRLLPHLYAILLPFRCMAVEVSLPNVIAAC